MRFMAILNSLLAAQAIDHNPQRRSFYRGQSLVACSPNGGNPWEVSNSRDPSSVDASGELYFVVKR